jgi:hypothetical protein
VRHRGPGATGSRTGTTSTSTNSTRHERDSTSSSPQCRHRHASTSREPSNEATRLSDLAMAAGHRRDRDGFTALFDESFESVDLGRFTLSPGAVQTRSEFVASTFDGDYWQEMVDGPRRVLGVGPEQGGRRARARRWRSGRSRRLSATTCSSGSSSSRRETDSSFDSPGSTATTSMPRWTCSTSGTSRSAVRTTS